MRKQSRDTSTHAQRQRLLNALEKRPVSTLYARKELDILMPAARVFELRKRGFEIVTHWTREETDSGNPHRVGVYCLLATEPVTGKSARQKSPEIGGG